MPPVRQNSVILATKNLVEGISIVATAVYALTLSLARKAAGGSGTACVYLLALIGLIFVLVGSIIGFVKSGTASNLYGGLVSGVGRLADSIKDTQDVSPRG